jgi:15-cis-phytoene synthase
MSIPLAESYRHCRKVARTRARNFYYSFLLLSREQRDAMCAVYAFMRHCDDLSDAPGAATEERRASLAAWRNELNEAFAGHYGLNPLWPALHDTVLRFKIPAEYLHEMIDGVSSDLDGPRVQTFDELYHYCYQVASVVGLTVIHIFGFESPHALPLAEKCGIAFQLTNIIRDVREDAENGRIYLPAEDLHRFGVGQEDLLADAPAENVTKMLSFQAGRARSYYRESAPLVRLVHARSRASLRAMISIYWALLDRIEAARFDVFSRRVRLPALQKVSIMAGSAAGLAQRPELR